MRTVTFSDRNVRKSIDRNFVPFCSNIEGDPTAGESIGHAPKEPAGDCIRGNGRQNVQTIFMTPDEEIFHVATGFLSPQDMLQEMQFAEKLFQSLNREDANRHDLVRTSHQDVLSDLGARDIDPGQFAASMGDLLQSAQNGGMVNPFQQLTNQLITDDQRFMVKRPLIHRTDFERDPGELVGRGKTFFSSSKSSNKNFFGR